MRRQTGKDVSLTTIRRLMRQTKLNDALLVTIGKIDVYWIDSCEKLKVVHKQAKELNGDHLITLNQAHAKSNETTEASKKKTHITHSRSKWHEQSDSSSEKEKYAASDKVVSYDSSKKVWMY